MAQSQLIINQTRSTYMSIAWYETRFALISLRWVDIISGNHMQPRIWSIDI